MRRRTSSSRLLSVPAPATVGNGLTAASVVPDDSSGHGGVEITAASPDRADGLQQFGRPALFQDVARGAGAQQLLQIPVVLMPGQGEHFDLRTAFREHFGRLETVDPWHRDIHHDDIGSDGLGLRDGAAAVGGFGDDLHVRLRVDDHLDAFAHRHVVIRQEDAQLLHAASPSVKRLYYVRGDAVASGARREMLWQPTIF